MLDKIKTELEHCMSNNSKQSKYKSEEFAFNHSPVYASTTVEICYRVAPMQNEWGGGQNEKIETYGHNFHGLWHTKCSMIFSTPKAWCTSALIKRRGWFWKSLCVWRWQCRIDIGIWGWIASSRRRQGGL